MTVLGIRPRNILSSLILFLLVALGNLSLATPANALPTGTKGWCTSTHL
jgi:hypothetical protein